VEPATGRIEFRTVGLFRKPIRQNLNAIRDAVITIQLGAGHGSGFVISRSGYVLTNHHVVGNGDSATVVFRNGLRVKGRVVRRHKARDVALVKLPIQLDTPLPIKLAVKPDVSDEVYAVGSPLSPRLKSSLTKGIVSAYRKLEGNFDYIQADVPITGGSSGGPLLDKNGNVIGISVASFVGGNAQNLNLFIPIESALKSLNISFD